jgi:hypothetical protein
MKITGSVALVTGANRGIGFAAPGGSLWSNWLEGYNDTFACIRRSE